MNLIHDKNAVPAGLRRDIDLVYEGFDVLDRVIGGGVELVDAVGAAFAERYTGFALSARLHVRAGIGTVDGFGEDSGCAGFSHTPRAAEQICVRQLPPCNGIFEGLRDIVLADKGRER